MRGGTSLSPSPTANLVSFERRPAKLAAFSRLLKIKFAHGELHALLRAAWLQPGDGELRVKRSFVFYSLVLLAFGAAAYVILQTGAALEAPTLAAAASGAGFSLVDSAAQMWRQLEYNFSHPIARLLLQILVIVVAARLLGRLFKRMGQPAVIGEVAAGIALGPSLLGAALPEATAFIFPAASLPGLQLLSQLGLILFLFIVGMEVDIAALRNRAHSAVVVSHASIVAPFGLGMALALYLYQDFAPDGVAFMPFALFMGAALSITAFPVLARIIQERGLQETRVGALSITCAAVDDVTAWSALAVVVGIARVGAGWAGLGVALLAAVYVIFMLKVVRPMLTRAAAVYASRENLGPGVVAAVLLLVLGSAYICELIGIHALFGAFLAGAIMPADSEIRRRMIEKLRDLTMLIFLPLFFAFTGLRTKIGLLNTPDLWIDCAIIIVIATVGKWVGSALAARFVGESWRDSLALGALMNTRGLMELIVLNIGLELGVLSDEIFAMMVLMALATTFMAGPALTLIDRIFGSADAPAASARPPESAITPPASAPDNAVLLAFGRRETGEALVRLAAALDVSGPLVALHMTPDSGLSAEDRQRYMQQSGAIVQDAAGRSRLSVEFVYRATDDVAREIIAEAQTRSARLLLSGGARTVLSDNLLGGVNRELIEDAPCTVGVLVERGLSRIDRVLVLRKDSNDYRSLELLQSACMRGRFRGAVLTLNESEPLPEKYGCFTSLQKVNIDDAALREFDLVVLDRRLWGELRNAPFRSILILSFPDDR